MCTTKLCLVSLKCIMWSFFTLIMLTRHDDFYYDNHLQTIFTNEILQWCQKWAQQLLDKKYEFQPKHLSVCRVSLSDTTFIIASAFFFLSFFFSCFKINSMKMFVFDGNNTRTVALLDSMWSSHPLFSLFFFAFIPCLKNHFDTVFCWRK